MNCNLTSSNVDTLIRKICSFSLTRDCFVPIASVNSRSYIVQKTKTLYSHYMCCYSTCLNNMLTFIMENEHTIATYLWKVFGISLKFRMGHLSCYRTKPFSYCYLLLLLFGARSSSLIFDNISLSYRAFRLLLLTQIFAAV